MIFRHADTDKDTDTGQVSLYWLQILSFFLISAPLARRSWKEITFTHYNINLWYAIHPRRETSTQPPTNPSTLHSPQNMRRARTVAQTAPPHCPKPKFLSKPLQKAWRWGVEMCACVVKRGGVDQTFAVGVVAALHWT